MRRDGLFRMGLIGSLVAIFACRSNDDATKQRIASLGTPAVAPPPSAPMQVVRAEVPELAKRLDAIRRKPDTFATSKDTDDKLITFPLKSLPGIGSAYFVEARRDAKAWRFGLDYLRCDELGQLGLDVEEIERRKGVGSSAWYKINGGPLDGALVKVFAKSVTEPDVCSVMPGSVEYWRMQGDLPRSLD